MNSVDTLFESIDLKMKQGKLLFTILTVLLITSCNRKDDYNVNIRIVPVQPDKRADIYVDDKLFTSLRWSDELYKPILFPVFTAQGTEITRGFPLNPRTGEQIDHLHQTGMWFTYGNVNGIDFWGNGYRGFKEPTGGVITHKSITRIQSRNNEATLVTSADWIKPDNKRLLSEITEYHFIARDSVRIIDRITSLTAEDTSVVFGDTKEGLFAIRVARQLEVPSKTPVILIDSTGKPSSLPDSLNSHVTGMYRNSEGITGEQVWGTRARWMDLSGIIGNEKISVIICDHPKNPGFPAYWHARGYGLFSINPLGKRDFTNGKEVFNFTIPSGKSAKFRYRVIISSGKHLTDSEINKYADEFGRKYKK